MLEWRFWPDFFWDERVGYYTIEGRGGARYKAFDYDRVKDRPPFPDIGVVDEKEMWSRFLYFARPIVTAAEKAKVRLTMHPNDPPVPVMRGVARIFHHTDGLRRFLSEQYGHVLREFAKAISGCMPGLSKEELYWRLDFLAGALTYAMADFGMIKRPAGASEAEHRNRAAQELIRFAAAGFKAGKVN